jgi:hypothetical protein
MTFVSIGDQRKCYIKVLADTAHDRFSMAQLHAMLVARFIQWREK